MSENLIYGLINQRYGELDAKLNLILLKLNIDLDELDSEYHRLAAEQTIEKNNSVPDAKTDSK